jgi:hypothetical protein
VGRGDGEGIGNREQGIAGKRHTSTGASDPILASGSRHDVRFSMYTDSLSTGRWQMNKLKLQIEELAVETFDRP